LINATLEEWTYCFSATRFYSCTQHGRYIHREP